MIPSRLEPLLRAGAPAAELADLFTDAGHELYLVGGSVRDLFLGATAEDLDFATNARPERIKEILSGWAADFLDAGEPFGTVGAIREGAVYEITTFRREVYRDASRKPQVAFADDIATDLSRRDFTVNALALRLPEPEIVDPHGGLADISAGMLRTPLAPEVSFGDDPLRMLRLFRFMSTLGFEADADALQAVRSMVARLEIVSAERVRDEFSKLLTGAEVAAALEHLIDTGLAEAFVPEVARLAEAADPAHRHKDVLAHTIAVVAKTPPELVLRLAALFHDVGKPDTRSFEGGKVSFHHHEVVGSRLTKHRLRELAYPKRVVDEVTRLVYMHMRPHTYALGWTDRAVRRYVRDAGSLLEPLNTLVRSDVTTANPKRARQIQRRIDELEDRIAELREQEELDAMRPPVDGHEVMAHLGIGPGPLVGEAMDMLLEHRLDHGPYTPDEAKRLLDGWWATRQADTAG